MCRRQIIIELISSAAAGEVTIKNAAPSFIHIFIALLRQRLEKSSKLAKSFVCLCSSCVCSINSKPFISYIVLDYQNTAISQL